MDLEGDRHTIVILSMSSLEGCRFHAKDVGRTNFESRSHPWTLGFTMIGRPHHRSANLWQPKGSSTTSATQCGPPVSHYASTKARIDDSPPSISCAVTRKCLQARLTDRQSDDHVDRHGRYRALSHRDADRFARPRLAQLAPNPLRHCGVFTLLRRACIA